MTQIHYASNLRFPSFTEPWKETSLKNVADFLKGSPFNKKDITPSGQYPVIHYGELFSRYNEIILHVHSKTNVDKGLWSLYGDILMPSSGGLSALGLATASSLLQSKVLLGGDINVLRPYKNINSIYLSYALNNNKSLLKITSGTIIQHIYNKDLKNITLLLPSREEQDTIATFLSIFSAQIEALKTKVHYLELYKKGLVQQLLGCQSKGL